MPPAGTALAPRSGNACRAASERWARFDSLNVTEMETKNQAVVPIIGTKSFRSDIMRFIEPSRLLPLARLREELVAIGKAIGLQEEAEQDGAIRRHGLVLITSRSPNELTRSALSLVILERALDDISLLKRSMLVQRHD